MRKRGSSMRKGNTFRMEKADKHNMGKQKKNVE